MKKKALIYLSLIYTFCGYSQSIIVIDSIQKSPIAFANIKFHEKDGTFTNENGLFNLDSTLTDSVFISHISYKSKKIKILNIKDTIILSPNIIELNEIKISKGKETIKKIDLQKKSKNFGSWPITSKSEILTLIKPSKDNQDAIIKKIKYQFVKRKYNEFEKNYKTAIRANIYSSVSDKLNKKLYSSEVYIIDAYKKENLEIELFNETIILTKTGLFFSIEIIGDIDTKGNISKINSSIRPTLNDVSNVEYSNKTFIKYTFDSKNVLTPLNEIFYDITKTKIERNLSIGLELTKY